MIYMSLKSKNENFTVIIPTLWLSNFTIDLLTSYENCTYVDEILVIDNAIASRPQIDFSVYKKLRFLEQKENIYVNPAWNLGVKEAKNELIAISNDDIIYNPEPVFKFISEATDWGAIGMSSLNFKLPASEISVEPGADIGGGWGCLIFVRKSEWIPISEDIKIWYGDNWIILASKKHNKPVLKLRTSDLIKTKMSTSSGALNFNPIIQRDIEIWKKWFNLPS